jgi:cell division septum initiation protein DivIVA
MAALELLANPEKLQKKLDSLEKAEKSAKAQIALAGPASEILKIRSQIDAELAEAHEERNKAHADVAKAIEDARVSADKLLAEAHEKAERIVMDAQDQLDLAESRRKEADEKLGAVKAEAEALRQRTLKLDAWRDELSGKSDDLAPRETELEQRKVKFATVQEQIASLLE